MRLGVTLLLGVLLVASSQAERRIRRITVTDLPASATAASAPAADCGGRDGACSASRTPAQGQLASPVPSPQSPAAARGSAPRGGAGGPAGRDALPEPLHRGDLPHLAATTPHNPYEGPYVQDGDTFGGDEDATATRSQSGGGGGPAFGFHDDRTALGEFKATLTTPRIELFDRHFARVSQSIRQNLDELEEQHAFAAAAGSNPDAEEGSAESQGAGPEPNSAAAAPAAAAATPAPVAVRPSFSPAELVPGNGTKVALQFTNHVAVQYNLTGDPPRSSRGDLVVENGTHLDVTSTYERSEIIPGDAPTTVKPAVVGDVDQSVGGARVVERVDAATNASTAAPRAAAGPTTASPAPTAAQSAPAGQPAAAAPTNATATTAAASAEVDGLPKRAENATSATPTVSYNAIAGDSPGAAKANRTRAGTRRLRYRPASSTSAPTEAAAGAGRPRTRARMIASRRDQTNTTNSVEESNTEAPAPRPSLPPRKKVTTRYSWRRTTEATSPASAPDTVEVQGQGQEGKEPEGEGTMVRVPVATVSPPDGRPGGSHNASTEPSASTSPSPPLRRLPSSGRRRLPTTAAAEAAAAAARDAAGNGTATSAEETSTPTAAGGNRTRGRSPLPLLPRRQLPTTLLNPAPAPTRSSGTTRPRGSVRFGVTEDESPEDGGTGSGAGGMSIPPTAAAWLLATLHGPAQPQPQPQPPTTTETPVLASPAAATTTTVTPPMSTTGGSGALAAAAVSPSPTAELRPVAASNGTTVVTTSSSSGSRLVTPAAPPTPTAAAPVETDTRWHTAATQPATETTTLEADTEPGSTVPTEEEAEALPGPASTALPTPPPTPTPTVGDEGDTTPAVTMEASTQTPPAWSEEESASTVAAAAGPAPTTEEDSWEGAGRRLPATEGPGSATEPAPFATLPPATEEPQPTGEAEEPVATTVTTIPATAEPAPAGTGQEDESKGEAVTETAGPTAASATADAFIRITVQATWEAVCKERGSFLRALSDLATREMHRNVTVALWGLGSGPGAAECEGRSVADDAGSEPRRLPLTVYLLDETGHFDKQLVETFYMLVSRAGRAPAAPLRIEHVDLVYGPLPTTSASSNAGVIAAITISCVGAVCLLLLAALLIVMRKRQKRFNYGQRCTPVSLDAYSLDSVSVYDSVRRKGALRASKRSYGNPAFDDPGAPSHPMNFAGLANFSSERASLEEEFEVVPQVTAKSDELPEGAETRNRYSNVIPLPETRVQLSVVEGEPLSDYINANYVKGPKNENKFYIACQAPLPSTVTDFWRMIWEQQSKVILMLTDLVENGVEKCADYLPPSEVLDCHRLFGDFQITLKKREEREKYVISTLQLKNLETNSWREVTHLWYLSWPHQGVPEEPNSIIAFLIEARPHVRANTGPTVVHCSPGTGRTGTVLACDICIRDFEQTRMVDIPRCVYRLRRDRAGAVKTKDQYVFIYQVLNTYATKLTGGGGSLDSI